MSEVIYRPEEALLFWLEVMADHARFIKDGVKPGNPNTVLVAENFINLFDRLLQKVTTGVEQTIINEILATIMSFREFKRELLGQSLRKMPVTDLSPTFYNHMLNELEDFLHVLNQLQSGAMINDNILGEHLIWVLDAAGHAAIVMSELDKVEYLYREEAKAYENSFDKMYLKAVEIAGYFRSDAAAVQPVLQGYNRQICNLMNDFIEYQTELKAGTMTLEVVGPLVPLVLDHMLREEQYYLKQLSRYSTVAFGPG
ncbi:MAG TPA: DUF2935 domain-containing protein [Bacillota bacterium]|nr:DUF2935 domain-containing protein [Bacillota bacterium]